MNDEERISGVNFDWHNPHTRSKIARAVRSRNAAEVSNLLQQGMSPDVPDNRGYTALHEASKSDDLLNIARLLIEGGAYIEHKTVDGETPLYKACQFGCEKLVKYYLASGCLVNNPTIDNVTPLHIACGKKNVKIVKMLIAAGANTSAKDNEMLTPLYYAIQFGNLSTVKLLLQAGSEVECVDNFNRTPLQFSCMVGFLKIFNLLVDHLGCSAALVNQQTADGWSLMMEAVQFKNFEIAKKLLSHGADTSVVDSRGMLALHIAAHCGHMDCFELLLRNTPISVINECAVAKDDLKHTRSLPCLLIDKNMLDGLKLLLNYGVSDDVLSCPAQMGDTLVSPVSFLLAYNNKISFKKKIEYLELLLSKSSIKDPEYEIMDENLTSIRSVEAAIKGHRADHLSCNCEELLMMLLNEKVNPDIPLDEFGLPLPHINALNLGFTSALCLLLAFSNSINPEQVLLRLIDNVASPTYDWNRKESEMMTFLVWASTDFKPALNAIAQHLSSAPPALLPKITPLYDVVKQKAYQVPSLKHLSRNYIKANVRSTLNDSKDFRSSIASFPLPPILIDFLLHQELLSYSV